MSTFKISHLKPLLESSGGIHLTAYFENRGDIADFKHQIRECIQRAHDYLTIVMNVNEQRTFLEPLDHLYSNTTDITKTPASIAVFLKQDFCSLLHIPLKVRLACQVATSFHIRPLLKWLQSDEDFLLLGVDKDTCYLALGSQFSVSIMDSFSLEKPHNLHTSGRIGNALNDLDFTKLARWAKVSWLKNCLLDSNSRSMPKLYLAGVQTLLGPLKESLLYDRIIKDPIANVFSISQMNSICDLIRNLQRRDALASLDRSIAEFRSAESSYRTRTNIFQVAKAVVQGRIKKIAIADDVSIYGKMDRKNGNLALHPFDLDHEDDDILDDLAQMVLLQGGDVIILPQVDIPNRRPLLAILDDYDEPHGTSTGKGDRGNFIGKRA